jgi:hypothetical protein
MCVSFARLYSLCHRATSSLETMYFTARGWHNVSMYQNGPPSGTFGKSLEDLKVESCKKVSSICSARRDPLKPRRIIGSIAPLQSPEVLLALLPKPVAVGVMHSQGRPPSNGELLCQTTINSRESRLKEWRREHKTH